MLHNDIFATFFLEKAKLRTKKKGFRTISRGGTMSSVNL